jgi:hypothetical protein
MGEYWWVAGVAVPLVGLLLGLDWKVHLEAHRRIEKAESKASALEKEFYDYKVNASMLFATVSAMSDIKRELATSLERIEDKLDKMSDRIDTGLRRRTERQ